VVLCYLLLGGEFLCLGHEGVLALLGGEGAEGAVDVQAGRRDC